MIILITASLSSKIYSIAPNRENFAFTERNQHRSDQNCRAGLEPWFGIGCVCLMWCYATSFLVLDLRCCWVGLVKNETLLKPNPKDQELEFHPCVNLHRGIFSASVELWKKWSLFLAHPTCWHERVTSEYAQESTWCWFLSLLDLRRNQSPETILICIVVLYFTHDNIVWIHMCDECVRSNVLSVCHMLWST